MVCELDAVVSELNNGQDDPCKDFRSITDEVVKSEQFKDFCTRMTATILAAKNIATQQDYIRRFGLIAVAMGYKVCKAEGCNDVLEEMFK
jgi:hypothetical protein